MISLPSDVKSNRIKVNGDVFNINLLDGIANLTLSGFDMGNNSLVFTYEDPVYGEKSVDYILPVGPKLYVPETLFYENGDCLLLKLPADACGNLNIYDISSGYGVLVDSVVVVGGEANYSFDSWDLGFYEVFVEFNDSRYYLGVDAFVNVVPNVIFADEVFVLFELWMFIFELYMIFIDYIIKAVL